MKVSIITVCFNSATTVEQTINSVLSQDYSDIEYIVVDGNSSDGTVEIIEKYKSQISDCVSESDAGIYDAMNKGIGMATGDIIGILNSDDIYAYPTVVSDIVNEFRADSSKSIIFGNLEFKNFINNRTLRFYSATNFRPFKLRFGWMPPHPSTFVKKSVYDKYGLYRIDMKISADYERFVRWLLVEKVTFGHLNKVLVHMRPGGASTAGLKSIYTLNQEIVVACKSNGIYTNMFLLAFKIPFKILELFKRG